MTESEMQTVARRIANDLFKNGAGERAGRLVLEAPYSRGHLGGWSESGARDQIYRTLLRVIRELQVVERPKSSGSPSATPLGRKPKSSSLKKG